MKCESTKLAQGDLEEGARALAGIIRPDALVVFAAPSFFGQGRLPAALEAAFPGVPVIGCSTAGEISDDGVSDETASIVALDFEKTPLRFARVPLTEASQSMEAGRRLAAELAAPDLKGILVFCPGLNINGSRFVQGVRESVGDDILVAGGLAGDGAAFRKTWTLFSGEESDHHVVAMGLYGDHVRLGSGSMGGWRPFGPRRRVTGSQENVLLALDDKSALQLYREYLGDKAKDLPASGLLYPFAIMHENDMGDVGLIRTILNIDDSQGSLVLAGDLPQDSVVCLMHANTDSLVDGAQEAARRAILSQATGDTAVFCVSCVGRKLIMGADIDEEVEVVREVAGDDAHIAGFYSYGEIGPYSDTNRPELHNQTMTIAHISEDLSV